VVGALQSVVDDPTKAQFHAAMRAAIRQGADLSGRRAKQDYVRGVQPDRHWTTPQPLSWKNGVPVIEYSHEANSLFETARP
jgi:hypothetical protein